MPDNILDWLKDRSEASCFCCEVIPLNQLDKWHVSEKIIQHDTKRFFSITGIQAIDNVTGQVLGEQPIINQPDIGVLGYILQNRNNRLQILLQAKTEPGNIGGTQIGPTVQATYSNYTCVHKGLKTRYIEQFIKNEQLIHEGTLQSEQGTRFLGKYNRNITNYLSDDEKISDVDGNWRWFDLEELFQIIDCDYGINTDARSVLINSNWAEFNINTQPFEKRIAYDSFAEKLYYSYNAGEEMALVGMKDVINLLEASRREANFSIKEVDLIKLHGWTYEDDAISNQSQFSVKGFHVNVHGREVPYWSQPLIHSHAAGLVILYCQVINGVLHFLIKLSREIGFAERVQYGPAVQVLNEKDDLFSCNFKDEDISKISGFTQSDEGGRFYHSNVEYNLIEINSDVSVNITPEYCWVTLRQIYKLLPVKGFFTNEFRSVLSIVLKYV